MGEEGKIAGVTAGVIAAVLVLAGLLHLAERVAVARALDAVSRRAHSSAVLLSASFRRELDKFGLVPVVLADDRDARDALRTRDARRLAQLDRKLEALRDETAAANVYLLDATGRTVASSNWRAPDSFVGHDYAFRSYFRQAMRTGAARQFALGQQSRQPGLYISKRLSQGGRPLGVFVVKVDFHALEREWRDTAGNAFVTDGRGVILVTANPAWRFQTTRPLSSDERASARRSLEYGSVPLTQNRLFASGSVATMGRTATADTAFVEATEPAPGGWIVHILAPTDAAVDAAVALARLTLGLAVLLTGALVLLWRFHRRGVAVRIEQEADARLATMRDQLIQANKLAALGQITAGVGHEINQPLAAIATYAHSARALMERDRPAEAAGTIDRILALTQRIGLITRELRGFARRATGEIDRVAVDDAVAGTALLLRDRLRMLDADLRVESTGLWVRAERVRLEQVLVNLVQNALDAGARTISVQVTIASSGRVAMTIADDGPGLSPAMRATLFQPFTTSKKDGLGLGLVICHDIVKEFGGTLRAETPAFGAAFVMELERAE